MSFNLRTHYSFWPKALFILGVVIISLLVVIFLVPKIPQPLSYHDFADKRTFLGIPNFADVISNAIFLIPGFFGLKLLITKRVPNAFIESSEKAAFYALFCGALLVTFGSGYYHLSPDNARLLWDRLPIAIIQGAILSIFLSDRMSVKTGLYWLLPIIVIGIVSVVYWEYTEYLGHGDLRFYGWYQGMPVVIVALLVLLFPPRYTGQYYLCEAFTLYALGRLGEWQDKPIDHFTHQIISGHTLKHIAMGAAMYSFVRYLRYRKKR